MTIRQMEVLQAVATLGKMNTAAQTLYISTAAVSQTIGEIEAEFGFKIFERLSRKLYITDAGQTLLQYCNQMLSFYEEMQRAVKSKSVSPRLRIGAPSMLGNSLMPTIIERAKKACPSAEFIVYIGEKANLEKKLLHDELDVAIFAGKLSSADLVATPFSKDETAIFCGRGHALYGRTSVVPVQELTNYPFICRDTGGLRGLVEQLFYSENIPFQPQWVFDNTEAIKTAVTANLGIAALPVCLAKSDLESGALYKVPIARHFEHALYMVRHKDKYISPTMQSFAAVLSQLG